jgi:K+-sensing histidine kinase KdpD
MDDSLRSVLFDQVNIAVAFFDGDGILIESNKSWEMIFLNDTFTEIILSYDDLTSYMKIDPLNECEMIHVSRAKYNDKTLLVRQKKIEQGNCRGIMIEVENISNIENKVLHSDRFFSEIMWKIRSRISSIQNVSTLFIEYRNDGLDEESLRLLKKTRLEIWETMRLAENIRFFSLLETDSLGPQLNLTTYSLRKLVESARLECEVLTSTMENTVSIRIDVDGALQISTDERILKKILITLMTNAIRYNSGDIAVTVSAEYEDEVLLINVSDNGYGIPECEQYKVFSYTYFGDVTDSKFNLNSGIDLYIARKLLKFIGGEINFESKKHSGTTFSISIKGSRGDDEYANG